MNENNLIIKNAVITRRNFEGREEKPYNNKGVRGFSVMLDNELAHILLGEGWNVKFKKGSDPDDPETPAFLSVAVSYENPRYIPKIVQVSYDADNNPRRTYFHENTVSNLDSADMIDIRLEIRPKAWENPNGHGIKAYLKTMYFTLVKDPFEDEYGIFSDELGDDYGDSVPFTTDD